MAQSFQAGVVRLTVGDALPFDALVTYPTEAVEAPLSEGQGLSVLTAARDAPIAAGGRFPVVLFSHGSGRGPGTPMLHGGLLLHLSRAGFVVVAPFHAGGARPFVLRPHQMRAALDAMLADARFAGHVDAARLGAMGFSFGGAVALLVAGARLDLAHLAAYCRGERDDPRACGGVPTDHSWDGVPSRASDDVLPVKALVLMEPYGSPFAPQGLAMLDVPALIYRALQSDMKAAGNILDLARALPRRPVPLEVPGGHFIFADSCPADRGSRPAEICDDPPGVDRAVVLRQVQREVVDFLRANL